MVCCIDCRPSAFFYAPSPSPSFPPPVQEGLSPLLAAVSNNNKALAETLITHGANVNCSKVSDRMRRENSIYTYMYMYIHSI